MATVTRSRMVASDPEEVWDVLIDYGAIARWAGFVEHSSMLRSGPVELGSTRRIQVGSTVLLERIVDLDAPTSLEYEIEGLPKLVSSARNRWALAPSPGGGTDVSITTTVTVGPRPPQRLVERVLGRVLSSPIRHDAVRPGRAPGEPT